MIPSLIGNGRSARDEIRGQPARGSKQDCNDRGLGRIGRWLVPKREWPIRSRTPSNNQQQDRGADHQYIPTQIRQLVHERRFQLVVGRKAQPTSRSLMAKRTRLSGDRSRRIPGIAPSPDYQSGRPVRPWEAARFRRCSGRTRCCGTVDGSDSGRGTATEPSLPQESEYVTVGFAIMMRSSLRVFDDEQKPDGS